MVAHSCQCSLRSFKHARLKKVCHQVRQQLPDFRSLPLDLSERIFEVNDNDIYLDRNFYPVKNHVDSNILASEHGQNIENNDENTGEFDLQDPENPESMTMRKYDSVFQNESGKKDMVINNEYVEKGSLESKESKLSKKAQIKVKNDLLKQRGVHHMSMTSGDKQTMWTPKDFVDTNKREYGDSFKYDSLHHLEAQKPKSIEETFIKMLHIVSGEHDEWSGDEHEDIYTMCIRQQNSVFASSASFRADQSQIPTPRNNEEIQLSCRSDVKEMLDSEEKDDKEKEIDEKPSRHIIEELSLYLMNCRNLKDMRQMKDRANEEIKKCQELIIGCLKRDEGDTDKLELQMDLEKPMMDDIIFCPEDQDMVTEDIAYEVKIDPEGQKFKPELDDIKTNELKEMIQLDNIKAKELKKMSQMVPEEKISDVKIVAEVSELKQNVGSDTQLNKETPKRKKRNRSMMKKQRAEIIIENGNESTKTKPAEYATKQHQRSPKLKRRDVRSPKLKRRDALTKNEQKYQAILKDDSEPSLTGYAEEPNNILKKLLEKKSEQNSPQGPRSLLGGYYSNDEKSPHNSVSDKHGIHKPAKRQKRGVFHYQQKRNMKWFHGNWKKSTISRKLASKGIPPRRWLHLGKERFRTWSHTHGQKGDSGGGSSYGNHGDTSQEKSANKDKGKSPDGDNSDNGDGDKEERHGRREDEGNDGQEYTRLTQEERKSDNAVPNNYKQFKKKHGDLTPEDIVCGLGKLSCEPIERYQDENWFAKMLTCLVTCLSNLLMTVTQCDTCVIVQSLLNHSGNCFAPLHQCSECKQVSALIGYHLTICNRLPDGTNSCSALCSEMRIALVEEYPPETVVVPFSRIQRYLRILQVSDVRDIMEAFPTIDDLQTPMQKTIGQPKRPLVRNLSTSKSYQPRLLSIVEALESGDKLKNAEGIGAEPIEEETYHEEPSAEELLYRYGRQENQAPKGDVKGPPENTTRIYGRSGPASLPVGSQRTMDPSSQNLSFSDRPVGTPGIGEVVYGLISQLLLVIRNWSKIKAELKRGVRRPRETREEGVILSKKLKIVGTRYQEDAQFMITARLGAGMSGTCHHAQDLITNFEFCIKKISLLKFEESELEIWSGLNHEHIVKLYGATRLGNTVYIHQEFIGGGSLMHCILAQRELNQRLSTATALRYLKQILEVLVYLQHNVILHEDLKPDNILLRSRDQVRTDGSLIAIADFGLSAHVNQYQRSTSNPVGGSTSWSPEKAASEGHSFPAEVWAAICILVNILSGYPPWIREFAEARMLHFIIKANSPPLRDIPSNIHADVRDVILQGWTVDPEQRPTAAELLKHPAFDSIKNSFMDPNYSLLSVSNSQRSGPNEQSHLLEKNMSNLENTIQASSTQAKDQSEELVGATCMDWNRTTVTTSQGTLSGSPANRQGTLSGSPANRSDDRPSTYHDESSREGQPFIQSRLNSEWSDIPCHGSQEEMFIMDDQLTMCADIRQQEQYVLQPYDENDYESATPAHDHMSRIPNLPIFFTGISSDSEQSSKKTSFASSSDNQDSMSMEKDATAATLVKLYEFGIGSDNHIDSCELFDSGGTVAKQKASGNDSSPCLDMRDAHPDRHIQTHSNPSDNPHQVSTESRRNPSPPSYLQEPIGDFNFQMIISDDRLPVMVPFITPKDKAVRPSLHVNVTAKPKIENVPHTHPENSQEKTPPFKRFLSELLNEVQDQLSTSTYGFQELFHEEEEAEDKKFTEEEITEASSLSFAQKLVQQSPSAADNGTVVAFCDEHNTELFKVRVTGQTDWHDLLHDSAGHKLLFLKYSCVQLILENSEEVELHEVVGPTSRSIRVVEVAQGQGHSLIMFSL